MHFGQRVDAAGTADEDLAVVLGVEVDEALMAKHAVPELHGAGESGLFIDGEETLDSGVRELGIGDGRERHGDTYTIISAEGGAFGFEPLAVDIRLDRIGHEIMGDIAVLLTDHVHVRLEDNALAVLVTGCSGDTHDDVHRLIGDTLDTMGSGERLQPAADLLLVLGGTGHFADLSKDVKYFLIHISVVLVVC